MCIHVCMPRLLPLFNVQLRSMEIEHGVESIIRERSLKVRYFVCVFK